MSLFITQIWPIILDKMILSWNSVFAYSLILDYLSTLIPIGHLQSALNTPQQRYVVQFTVEIVEYEILFSVFCKEEPNALL